MVYEQEFNNTSLLYQIISRGVFVLVSYTITSREESGIILFTKKLKVSVLILSTYCNLTN